VLIGRDVGIFGDYFFMIKSTKKILIAIVAIAVVGAAVLSQDVKAQITIDTNVKKGAVMSIYRKNLVSGKEETPCLKAYFGMKGVCNLTEVKLPTQEEVKPPPKNFLCPGVGPSFEVAPNIKEAQIPSEGARNVINSFSGRLDLLYLIGSKEAENADDIVYHISPSVFWRGSLLYHFRGWRDSSDGVCPYLVGSYGGYWATSFSSSVDGRGSIGAGFKYKFGNWVIPAPGFVFLEASYLWNQVAKNRGYIEQNRNIIELSGGISFNIGNTTRRIDTLRITQDVMKGEDFNNLPPEQQKELMRP
jgi:hypothetical protein